MPTVKIGEMELYDVQELSSLLGVQAKTIRRYLKDGRLQGRKLARKWYVTADSLKAYFQQPESGEISLPSEESLGYSKIVQDGLRSRRQ